MLRFRKLFIILLLAIIAAEPRLSHAKDIDTENLDGLCFWSTDVVEASLIRHHQPGTVVWEDTFTATVINSIAGQYHSGDQITSFGLDLYRPAETGQRCILFIARRRISFYGLLFETTAPHVTDMLLIDPQDRVQRYFQFSNPGGLRAEGYFSSLAGPSNDLAEQSYPTLAAERSLIASKWSAMNRLRPLLSHHPRREDVPILLSLLRERRSYHAPQAESRLQDGVTDVIAYRLSELSDPSAALDALTTMPNEKARVDSGLETGPFNTHQSIAYVKAVLRNPHESSARRAAAAEVLRVHSELK